MSPSSLSFVAIDFETANSSSESVCQVGVSKVMNGAITETKSWLVKPPTGIDSFSSRNIGIHGIKPKDVLSEGRSWNEVLRDLEKFIGGLPLVAHNSSFDEGVFEASTLESGLSLPNWEWHDSLSLSRNYLSLPNHKLPTISEHLGIVQTNHHDAGNDAEVCARIVLKIAELASISDFNALWSIEKSSAQDAWFDKASKAKVSELPSPNPDAPQAHPLHGEYVVVTGQIGGMTRWEAFEAIAERGGQPQKGVTRKTTLLVVANKTHFSDIDVASTGKGRKALQYRERGQEIRFISVGHFNELLEWTENAKVELTAIPKPSSLAPQTSDHTEPQKLQTVSPTPAQPSAPEEEEKIDHPLAPNRSSSLFPATSESQESDKQKNTSSFTTTHAPKEDRKPQIGTNPYPVPPSKLKRQEPVSEKTSASRPVRPSPQPQPQPQPMMPKSRPNGIIAKIIGWVLLVSSAAAIFLYLLFLVIGLAQDPQSAGMTVGILLVSLILLLIPLGVGALGAYLIWFRKRKISK